jgi:hypothetical protein
MISRLEDDIRVLRAETTERIASLAQKINYYKSRYDMVNRNYVALQRRRDYEIEGFTNDILSLRTQLRNLERSIVKYDSLEDKELVLLNLARATGERANQISNHLQDLKVFKEVNIERGLCYRERSASLGKLNINKGSITELYGCFLVTIICLIICWQSNGYDVNFTHCSTDNPFLAIMVVHKSNGRRCIESSSNVCCHV